jgi:hypothetical protein
MNKEEEKQIKVAGNELTGAEEEKGSTKKLLRS